MNILGISSSPRAGGNTDTILDEVLRSAKRSGAKVEKIFLNDLIFRPCQECGGCDQTGVCVLDDDMRGVYEKAARSDVLVVASPVFFGTVSAQLKSMIDRFQCIWVKSTILKEPVSVRGKRKGAFICVAAADKKDFFENSKKVVKNLFAILNVTYSGEIFCAGVDSCKGVLEKSSIIKKARLLGRRLANPK